MRLSTFFLFTSAFLICSCNREQISNSDVYIDSFSEESNTSFFDRVFSDIKVIPLDLGDSILGSHLRLSFKEEDDRLLITDQETGSVFLLNRDGTLVSSFTKVGRGPGEYTYLQSGAYHDKHVFVLADGNHFYEYSEQGDFLNAFELEQSAHDFVFLDDTFFTFFVPRYEGENVDEDRLVTLDTHFQRIGSFFPMSFQLYTYRSHLTRVSGEDNHFLCIQPWPRVDKCDQESVKITYRFDFHGKEYPQKLLEQDSYEAILDILTTTPEIYYIADAFENPQFLLISLFQLVNGIETRVGWWLINKTERTSQIEYFEYTGTVFSALGMPVLLTQDDKVLLLCDIVALNDIVRQHPYTKIAEQIKGISSQQVLLLCTISY